MCEASMEMPKYNCHKQVWALKIKKIVINPNESYDLFFEEDGYAPINMEKEEHKSKPEPDIGWYYVVYKDGYKSFSPAKEFEDGYTLA